MTQQTPEPQSPVVTTKEKWVPPSTEQVDARMKLWADRFRLKLLAKGVVTK